MSATLEFPSISLMETIVRCISTNPRKGWSVKNWELETGPVVRFDYMGTRYRVALVTLGSRSSYLVEEVVGGMLVSSDKAHTLRDMIRVEAGML
jgi:hypothetical protein